MLELTAIQKVILALAIVTLGGSGAYIFVARSSAPSAPPTNIYQPPSAIQQVTYIMVQVGGAVNRPGLYQLWAGARVYEAIQQAGGFTGQADQEAVNLAAVLEDGQKVVVPTLPAEPSAPQPASALSPSLPVAAAGPPPAPPTAPRPTQPADSGSPPSRQVVLIDLNSATQQDLERIPGIGPVIAQRILRYRAQYGGFRRIEELMLIQGIGQRTFELLKPYVTLGSPPQQ